MAAIRFRLPHNWITAAAQDQTLLLATFDLGGSQTLQSGIVVLVGEGILWDALSNAIAEAQNLNKNDYNPETWAALQEAVISGKLILATGGVSQEMVNNAATAIMNAIAGLKKEMSLGKGSGSTARYTVTFNTNGGNAVVHIKIISGEKPTIPTNPIKAGYTFTGWFSDK